MFPMPFFRHYSAADQDGKTVKAIDIEPGRFLSWNHRTKLYDRRGQKVSLDDVERIHY
jgi:hypothetical protein